MDDHGSHGTGRGWRRGGVFLAGLAAATLAAASVAWACTAYANISITPQTGPPGSEMTVQGRAFAEPATSNPVEIRWGSATGPVLATAPGPSFSVPVTVPDADPGVHTVVALQRDKQGTLLGRTSAQFEVTDPAPAAAAPGEPSPAPAAASPAPEEQPARQPARQQAQPAPAGRGAPAPAATPAPAAPPAPVAVVASAPVAPAAQAAVPAPADEAAVPAEEPALGGPAAGLVSGDLWSGFQAGAPAASGAGLAAPTTTDRTGAQAGTSAALLSVVVAMGSAAGWLTLTRRRRALAPVPSGAAPE